jgi:hypothetical protein
MSYYVPTTEEWELYLQKEITSNNYFIFHGLLTLSQEDLKIVSGALINGDITIPDLHRLGSFTTEEIQVSVSSIITQWDNKKISSGLTETSGYNYLLSLDNLNDFFEEIKETAKLGKISVNTVRDVEFSYGENTSYSDKTELLTNWITFGNPEGLLNANKTLITEVFPLDEAGVRLLPINNSDLERQDLLWKWYSDIFTPILALDTSEKIFDFLYSSNNVIGKLRILPSLVEFVIGSRIPYYDSQLQLHQEAIARSALGEYSLLEMEAKVEEIKNSSISSIRMTRDLSEINFQLKVIRAWCTETSNIITGLSLCEDVLLALYTQKTVIKNYIEGCYLGCKSNLVGIYPPPILNTKETILI